MQGSCPDFPDRFTCGFVYKHSIYGERQAGISQEVREDQKQEHSRRLCGPPFLAVDDNKGAWLFELPSLETGKSAASSCIQGPGVSGNHQV